MRFLVDMQLPVALCAWLRAKGHVADHVGEVLAVNAADTAIASHARAHGLVIVSKDADFGPLVSAAGSPQLLYVRVGNATNRILFDVFERRFPAAQAELHAGKLIVEITGD